MYKFVALLVALSSVSLALASPYGSRLMASSGYGAAAPVAPAPGIFEVPAATPFVELTTAGYGQREIITEAPVLDVVTPAPELPVTQAYGSAPVTEAPVLDVVTPAPELPVAPVTQAYGSAPVAEMISREEITVEATTAGYGQREIITEAPVLDVVTPAPELPVTQGYGSAPVTEMIAREEITTPFVEVTTPFVEVTTAGYGQREIMREIITEAPVTQGYGSAPVFQAVHHASAY